MLDFVKNPLNFPSRGSSSISERSAVSQDIEPPPQDPTPSTRSKLDITPPHRGPTYNVVLFGETGVGKSSVINLIARRDMAKLSWDVDGCTMQATSYHISFDGMDFIIFDVAGLEEPEMRVIGYLKATEKVYELIMKLVDAGGIHLLLFCMHGGRITATTQSNYRLFYELLCRREVPITLFFTGLEREVNLEDWWMRNRTHIEHYGIKSSGHASVRAIEDEELGEDLKFKHSQDIIRALLKEHALKQPFLPEPYPWFGQITSGMTSFIVKKKVPKQRDVMKVLIHRCKIDPDTSRNITNAICRRTIPMGGEGDDKSDDALIRAGSAAKEDAKGQDAGKPRDCPKLIADEVKPELRVGESSKANINFAKEEDRVPPNGRIRAAPPETKPIDVEKVVQAIGKLQIETKVEPQSDPPVKTGGRKVPLEPQATTVANDALPTVGPNHIKPRGAAVVDEDVLKNMVPAAQKGPSNVKAIDIPVPTKGGEGHGAGAAKPEQETGEQDALTMGDIHNYFARDLTGYVERRSSHPVAWGSYGEIYKGSFKVKGKSTNVAIKVTKMYEDDDQLHQKLQRFRRELVVWLNLVDHSNVLQLFGTIRESGTIPAMICPWVENGALSRYLEQRNKDLTATQRLILVNDVAGGLRHLHSQSVVHGDLSGSNVLVHADGRACITDFGLSVLLVKLGGTTFAASRQAGGTLRWMDPELVDPQKPEARPNKQTDVYSFGSLMLQILTGNVPYYYYPNERHIPVVVGRGERPTRPELTFKLVTDKRWRFIERCWSSTEPRPCGAEIVEFTGNDLAENR